MQTAAPAATQNWTAGSGSDINWSNPANWSASGSPDGNSLVFTNAGASLTPGTPTSVVDANYSINGLTFTNSSGNYHLLQIGAGNVLTVTNNLLVYPVLGNPGTTDVVIAGSTLGTGKLVVSNTAANIVIGYDTATFAQGFGKLDLSGLGTFSASVNNVDIGYAPVPYPSGILTLADQNTITANKIRMGYWGSQLPGAFLYLGQTNTLNVDSISVDGADSSNGGNATMAFRSGLTNPFVKIRDKSGTGRASLTIGDHGTPGASADKNYGTVTFSGGTVDALLSTVTIGTGGGFGNPAGNGEEGIGTLTMTAGTFDALTMAVGKTTSAQMWANGRGTVNLNGGTMVAGTITMADRFSSSGLNSAYGTLNLNGGTLQAVTIQKGANNGTPLFLWSSGTLGNKAGSNLTVTADIPLTLQTAATHTVAVEAGQTGTIDSVISGAGGTGGITKSGNGRLVLGGNNTYPGSTVVNAGTLVVNGSLNASANGITVGTAAALGGNGTIGRGVTVSSGGAIAPGNSAGTLTVASLSLASGAIYAWEIGPGTVADSVTVTNTGNSLTLGSSLTVQAIELDPTSASTNDVFALFSFSGNAPTLPTTVTFQFVGSRWISDNPHLFLQGNQVLLTGVGLVPEPSTVLLFGLGGLLVVGQRRRNKRARAS